MKGRVGWIVGGLAGVAMLQIAINVVLDARAERARLAFRITLAGTPASRGDVRASVHPVGRADEVVAEGDSRETLAVVPGAYDVRVVLSASDTEHEQWFREVDLQAGKRVVQRADFAVGRLGIEAVLRGPGDGAEQVLAYAYAAGDEDRVRAVIRPDEQALVAAGTYDVRAVLLAGTREQEAVWLRGVEVQRGSHVRPRVEFRRGRLVVHAFHAGEPLRRGAASLTVHRAGDSQEEVLDEGLAGVPLGLPGGRYDVRVTYTDSDDRSAVWLRDVALEDGQDREERVDFACGTLTVEASLGESRVLDEFEAYVYYYREGDHREPVAYTTAGRPAVLSAGRYDVRAHFYRSHDRPDVWVRGVELAAGQRSSHRIAFDSGSVIVRAYDARGEELVGDNVFVRIHAHGARSRPIAVARSGEEIVLTAGHYALHLEDTRTAGRAKWLDEVTVRAGRRDELSVHFP